MIQRAKIQCFPRHCEAMVHVDAVNELPQFGQFYKYSVWNQTMLKLFAQRRDLSNFAQY